jgi:hypothetical protein
MPWPAKRYLGTDTFRYPAPIICQGIVPCSLCRHEPLKRSWSLLVTAQVRQLRFAFAIDFSGRRGRFSIQESDEPASGRHAGRRGQVNGAVVWLCSPAHSRKTPQILPLRGRCANSRLATDGAHRSCLMLPCRLSVTQAAAREAMWLEALERWWLTALGTSRSSDRRQTREITGSRST